MSNTTHYSLEVRRLADIKRGSRTPGLYVKLMVGKKLIGKSRIIREDEPPDPNATFAFWTSDDSDVISIFVSEESRFRTNNRVVGNRQIGRANISIRELLTRCVNSEVNLQFFTLADCARTTSTSVGTICLYLKDVDVEKRARIDVELARQHIKQIERSANMADSTSNTVGSLVRKLDEVVKAVDDISSRVHPFLNLAWQTLSVLYKVVSSQFKTDKRLVELVDLMHQAFSFASDAKTLSEKSEKLKETISGLLGLTIELCAFVEGYTARNFLWRTLKIRSRVEIDDYKDRLLSLKRSLDSGVTLHGTLVASRVSIKVDIIELRQRLHSLELLLEPIKFDTSSRARCLPNTCMRHLKQIKEWLFSMESSPKQNILWLNGIAGSGKSTIAASVMDYCDDKSRLAAFLFFQRGRNEYRSVIRTIAYQLAAFEPSLADHIIRAVEQLKNITGSLPQRQFEKILLEPLKSSIGSVQGPVVIILDALDECGTMEQRREILQLLKIDFRELPLEFRFLITSRPENDILKSLSLQSHILEIKLEPTSRESRNDVRSYIANAMREAVADSIRDELAWVSTMNTLSRAADGLFIWASIAVNVVSHSDNPFGKLDDLVSNIRSLNGLDNLYATVLEQSGISWEDPQSVERFRKVLGLVLFGKESVSDDDIDNILDLGRGKSCLTLQRLRSVLWYEPGEPVRLHHASFADYLLSPESSGNQPWFVDSNHQKHAIVARCFDVMENHLCFNICNLDTSFIRNDDIHELDGRIAKNIPSRLSYACKFWAEHLRDVPYSTDYGYRVASFAYNRLTYWFEVLSLTKHFNHVASRALLNAVLWTSSDGPETSAFLWDAYRLVNIFNLAVSQSAPHIYLSMISLLKDESIVSKHYSETHPTITAHRSGTKPPTCCIKILQGHDGGVNSVAFSSDGKFIASGSNDQAIRIWDAESGKLVVGPLEGHIKDVCSVAFSPDNKCIVSGSGDHTIRVWDTESGEVLAGPFNGHTDWVYSVAFSPNGKRIVSASSDCTIRVWDIESKETVAGPLAGHSRWVRSVAFSPNGRYIVSGSGDHTILVWDIEIGEVVAGPFEGHDGWVSSVAFSPDGKNVVSGSFDCTIRVWDVEGGNVVAGPFKGHADLIESVAFSPDGERVVSGSADCTIRVWNVESGEVVAGPFEGHSNSVMSVAFSADGKRVVSGSLDCTIRVWDTGCGEIATGLLNGHTDWVQSVAFSSNGKRIVSGASDCTIRVWDIESGEMVTGLFNEHTNMVTSVAFSSDGKHIASGSWDHTARTWEIVNGQIVKCLLEQHGEQVTSVAFSPDGKRLVSGSFDCTIRVWDAENGKVIAGPSKKHTDCVYSVAFSPDGKCIASGSADCTICVWDVESGEVVAGPLEGHTDWVSSVSFSPDGKCIVSGSDDCTIRIWDVGSGKTIAGPFEGHTDQVNSVAYSPNGKCVVSGSGDNTIRVWDVESGHVVAGPLLGHTDWIMSVSFSPDGRQVVSGSGDLTIRIWSVEAEPMEQPSGNSRATNETSLATSPDSNFGSNWTMSEDGWILGKNAELLTWIPPDVRQTLLPPYCKAVFGWQFATTLDLAASPLGENWTRGYKAHRN